jgi:predicted N-acetyltransferase YhbS
MSAATATLIPLEAIDPAEIELLLDRAFGPGRHQRTAYLIREGMDWLAGLSFAALDDDEQLAGTIQAYPVALTDPAGRAHPLIMIGPIAVAPERHNQGFGRAMLAAQGAAIDPRAPLPQVLIGDAPYYAPFGFTAAYTAGWRCPGPWDPARLLVRCENPAVLPKEGMLGPWRG